MPSQSRDTSTRRSLTTRPLLTALAAFAASSLCTTNSARAQVSTSSLDTFQDGSIQNWAGGAIRTNLAGGPLGPSDRFLQVDNGPGSASGSKIATHNADPRWVGDYLGAGVNAIQVDMMNMGPATLEMRLVLFGATPTGGGRWTSNSTVVLAPNVGWQTFTFPITEDKLVSVLGTVPYSSLITNVTQIMFRHDPGTPSSGGAAGNGLLGLDNIRAIPAPGAASGSLLATALFAARRRRQ